MKYADKAIPRELYRSNWSPEEGEPRPISNNGQRLASVVQEEAIRMEKDWKVGDVVRPKAGGPDMCIAGFETDAASGERTKSAVCEWFVGNKSQTGSYQVEMLEFVRQMDDVSFSGKSGR
jgi:uncharacterized protein YodC (DUF2158 family)